MSLGRRFLSPVSAVFSSRGLCFGLTHSYGGVLPSDVSENRVVPIIRPWPTTSFLLIKKNLTNYSTNKKCQTKVAESVKSQIFYLYVHTVHTYLLTYSMEQRPS